MVDANLPPQPRFRGALDINLALAETAREVELWLVTKDMDAPAFSGGLLDAWPAWAVDAINVCRAEQRALRLFLEVEARRKVAPHG